MTIPIMAIQYLSVSSTKSKIEAILVEIGQILNCRFVLDQFKSLKNLKLKSVTAVLEFPSPS